MNPWQRNGFYYEVHLALQARSGLPRRWIFRLNFFDYHFIRLIHGEEELISMIDRAIYKKMDGV